MTKDEAKKATRNYFLSRHPMRIRGRSMNQEEVFDIRFDSFNAGFDAGYEAAVAAERERVCEWRRSEPFLLTSECGYTAEVEELDNPFCPKCGGRVAEREKEGEAR